MRGGSGSTSAVTGIDSSQTSSARSGAASTSKGAPAPPPAVVKAAASAFLSTKSRAAARRRERRDDDDVREIDALLAAIDMLGSEVDPGHLIELDERIHQCIYRCTHNPYLASDLDRYYAHALRIWFLALPTITHLQDAVVEHRELLDAVRCQDADRATTVMSKHVNEFEAEMRRAL